MFRITFGYGAELINILIEKDREVLYDICRTEDKGIIDVFLNKKTIISLSSTEENHYEATKYAFSDKCTPLEIYRNKHDRYSSIHFEDGTSILSNDNDMMISEYYNGKKISNIQVENTYVGINASLEILIQEILEIDTSFKAFQGDNSIVVNISDDDSYQDALDLIMQNIKNILIFL